MPNERTPVSEGLRHYFDNIQNHELLTIDQEKALVRRCRRYNDTNAANRLVCANLRLVVKIAHTYHARNGSVPLDDLIQEGNCGLVYAVRKYDPEKNIKFSYYAVFWIRAYILKFIMNNYSLVKIGTTQAQRKLFFNLNKIEKKLHRNDQTGSSEQISGYTGVDTATVDQMKERMFRRDISLDGGNESHADSGIIDTLVDPSDSAEEKVASRQLRELSKKLFSRFEQYLNNREHDIFKLRLLSGTPLTLKHIGNRHGVSRERIRQNEIAVIKKMKAYLKRQLPDWRYYQVDKTA